MHTCLEHDAVDPRLYYSYCVWLLPPEGAQTYSNRPIIPDFFSSYICTVGQWLQHSDSDHKEGITAIAPQRLNHSIRHRELDETSSVTHWTLEDPSHSHNHACSSCCSWTMLWISPHGVKYCMCSWVHVCVSICFLQSGLCCPATLDHTLFLLIRGCTVGEIDMMLSTTD